MKNGVKCGAMSEMLNVNFGECSINKTSVYKWFQEGREDAEE